MQNLKQGVLVNGSLGRVISFEQSNEGAGAVEGAGDAASLQNNSAIEIGGNPTAPPPMVDAQANPNPAAPQKRFWPRVLFQNGIEHVCSPEDFTVNNADGTVAARRRQVTQQFVHYCNRSCLLTSFVEIPLILAWALSVHKSQGQTLERVKVNLERTFEMGQGASHCTFCVMYRMH